jgi:hypothetical protein
MKPSALFLLMFLSQTLFAQNKVLFETGSGINAPGARNASFIGLEKSLLITPSLAIGLEKHKRVVQGVKLSYGLLNIKPLSTEDPFLSQYHEVKLQSYLGRALTEKIEAQAG